jgi:hypothetical protein
LTSAGPFPDDSVHVSTPQAARDPLAQALLDLGNLSSDHLKKGEALQSIHGGGLDTALLEIGVLDERSALEALARARGAPAVDPHDLREIPPEVLRLLPAKAAHRLRAVPFRASAASAHVAVLDARDLGTQDELAFVIGRRVRLFVTTETRMVEALVRHYGGSMPSRFRALLDRLPAPLPQTDDPAAPEEFDPTIREMPSFAPRPGEEERRRRAERAEQPAPIRAAALTPSPPTPAAPRPATEAAPNPRVASPTPKPTWVVPLSEAERARLRPPREGNPLAQERDAIADDLLRDVLPGVDRAVLLRSRGKGFEGWCGAGVGVDLQRLAAFTTDGSTPSLASLLDPERTSYVGPLAHLADFRRLSEVWSGGTTGGALLPLRLRNRLGAILYLDRADPPIQAREVAAWEGSCARAARRLEACLLRGKHRR